MTGARRVRGRTAAQLRDDRAAVREAVAHAVRVMVDAGAVHGCAVHFLYDDECPRCAWVNEQLAGPRDDVRDAGEKP
jgi:hypothetical protein